MLVCKIEAWMLKDAGMSWSFAFAYRDPSSLALWQDLSIIQLSLISFPIHKALIYYSPWIVRAR